MIVGPGDHGVAFTGKADGNQRSGRARTSVAQQLGISPEWATVRQVHGSTVVRVSAPGVAGEGDAIWTTESNLPVAVLTADCFGVVVGSSDAVGVAHAGWRGTDSSVVVELRNQMTEAGHPPAWAAIGPGIQACCFEVGPEVAAVFPESRARTSWGTESVNLQGELESQLSGLQVWASSRCTMSDPGWFSYRATGTDERLASIAWLS